MTGPRRPSLITPVAGRGIPADAWRAYKAGVRDAERRLAAELASLLQAAGDQAATLEVARDALLDGPESGGGACLAAADLPVVFSALYVAADHKRDLADNCAECTGQPDTGLCGDCQEWLLDADGYDALADRLAQRDPVPPPDAPHGLAAALNDFIGGGS